MHSTGEGHVAASASVAWKTCVEEDCIGVRLPWRDRCWAHVDSRGLDTALARLGKNGQLDARGVQISTDLLHRLLNAAPRNKGRIVLTKAWFDRAVFNGVANFGRVIFEGDADFSEAVFHQAVDFAERPIGVVFAERPDDGAVFNGVARFVATTFNGVARFGEVIFEDDAYFDKAIFNKIVHFIGRPKGAVFEGRAFFEGATFKGSIYSVTFGGVVFTGTAHFERAVFTSVARFDGFSGGTAAVFNGSALFRRAVFKRDVYFKRVTFNGGRSTGYFGPDFEDVVFEGDAYFDEAVITDIAHFNRANFKRDASFSRAVFTGRTDFPPGYETAAPYDYETADFAEATFTGSAMFNKAVFTGPLDFEDVVFEGDVYFDEAVITDIAHFNRANFKRDASFDRAIISTAEFRWATFDRARQLGPMLVCESLIFDEAVFAERVQVEACAAVVSAQRAKFPSGVQLRVRWALVVLDDADLAAPSLLAGAPAWEDVEEEPWAQAIARHLPEPRVEPSQRWWPILASLRRADVAGLAVANVDLRACQFADAHNLDKLKVATVQAFAPAPEGWRWTVRQTLAEEHNWRRQQAIGHYGAEHAANSDPPFLQPRRAGWRWSPACHLPSWAEAPPLEPEQIAGLYRALRKSQEDNKDEPGAADFYYGEMEMRRHARGVDAKAALQGRRRGPWVAATTERIVLWLYWLTSGYALRAWRALTTLAVVVLLAACGFAWWGLAPSTEPSIRPVAVDARGAPIYADQPVEQPVGLEALPTAIRVSSQATTALLRGPDQRLTPLGEWLHLILRLVGPVLLGVAVLSIRNRVRR